LLNDAAAADDAKRAGGARLALASERDESHHLDQQRRDSGEAALRFADPGQQARGRGKYDERAGSTIRPRGPPQAPLVQYRLAYWISPRATASARSRHSPPSRRTVPRRRQFVRYRCSMSAAPDLSGARAGAARRFRKIIDVQKGGTVPRDQDWSRTKGRGA
jgi:hypothetical protein